jgi:hypothetical protein
MNKDDFDRFWTACVPREARASNENIFDDVIKAIDSSEKYKHLTESKLLEQYRERGQKIHELSQDAKKYNLLKEIYGSVDEFITFYDHEQAKRQLDKMYQEEEKNKKIVSHLKKLNILYILGVLRLHENEAPSNEQAEILADIKKILEEEK